MPIAEIQSKLADMDIGEWGVHEGVFLNHPIFIVYLRDEDYNPMFMSAFAPNKRMTNKPQVRCGGAVTFYYPHNHGSYFAARPYVDHANENRMMQDGHALEESVKTHRVAMRSWTCDIGMSEANALGFWVNGTSAPIKEGAMSFRKQVAWEDLVALEPQFHYTLADVESIFFADTNRQVADEAEDPGTPAGSYEEPTPVQASTPTKKKRRTARSIKYNGVGHNLKKIPGGHVNHLVEGDVEGTVVFTKIDADKIDKYPQYHCSYAGCNGRIRTYCACQPAEAGTSMIVYCNVHFVSHVAGSAAPIG